MSVFVSESADVADSSKISPVHDQRLGAFPAGFHRERYQTGDQAVRNGFRSKPSRIHGTLSVFDQDILLCS